MPSSPIQLLSHSPHSTQITHSTQLTHSTQITHSTHITHSSYSTITRLPSSKASMLAVKVQIQAILNLPSPPFLSHPPIRSHLPTTWSRSLCYQNYLTPRSRPLQYTTRQELHSSPCNHNCSTITRRQRPASVRQ